MHIRRLTLDTVVAGDGSSIATIHAENAADSAAAVMAVGQASLPYVAAYQTLDIVEAYTQKADGKKVPVDASAIYDQLPQGSQGVATVTDLHVKTIVFPQFAAGDTAVYTARLTTQHAIFPHEYWGGNAFPVEVAYDDVEETLTAPSSLALHVENHDVSFETSRKDGQTVYHWHYSAQASPPEERASVDPLAHVPHYFVSTFRDYAALGRAYAAAAAPEMAVTPTVKTLADGIVKDAHGEREIVRALYEWVTGHIRYVAVELGKGTLIPHAADAVVANGYGDCKDHVTLLSALLKAEGIDSEGVLLNATTVYTLSDVPTFAGLNHIITYVPSLHLYLDSTPGVAPFGVLPITEYGKPAVYASETAPRLGTMPVLPEGLSSITTKTASHLSKDGVLTGTTTTTATGPFSILLRYIGLGAQAVGPETAAKRILQGRGFGSSATGTLVTPPPTELADSYAISGSFTAQGWSDQLSGTQEFALPGGMRVLGLSGDGFMGTLGDDDKPDREIPCYSGTASEDLSLEAPAGAHFSKVPSDTHVKTDTLRFDSHWSLDRQTLSVHRSFASRIDTPLCSVAVRNANAAALKSIFDDYNVSLSFEPAEGATSSEKQSGAATAPQDSQFAAMLQEAVAAAKNNQYETAIAKFSAVLAERDVPAADSNRAHLGRALVYARRWRYDEALADINAVLTQMPGDTKVLGARAEINFLRADFANALADCNALLARYPGDPMGLHFRAIIEMETAQYADAIRDFTGELTGATDPNARVLRAVAYHRLGKEKEAAADIALAVEESNAKAQTDYDAIVGSPAGAPPRVVAMSDWSSEMPAEKLEPANTHGSAYPPLSARLGEQGRTEVGFEVEPDGSVRNPVVLKSSGFSALDAAALESVKSWRYKPALRDGRPVSVHFLTDVNWVMTDSPA